MENYSRCTLLRDPPGYGHGQLRACGYAHRDPDYPRAGLDHVVGWYLAKNLSKLPLPMPVVIITPIYYLGANCRRAW